MLYANTTPSKKGEEEEIEASNLLSEQHSCYRMSIVLVLYLALQAKIREIPASSLFLSTKKIATAQSNTTIARYGTQFLLHCVGKRADLWLGFHLGVIELNVLRARDGVVLFPVPTNSFACENGVWKRQHGSFAIVTCFKGRRKFVCSPQWIQAFFS